MSHQPPNECLAGCPEHNGGPNMVSAFDWVRVDTAPDQWTTLGASSGPGVTYLHPMTELELLEDEVRQQENDRYFRRGLVYGERRERSRLVGTLRRARSAGEVDALVRVGVVWLGLAVWSGALTWRKG